MPAAHHEGAHTPPHPTFAHAYIHTTHLQAAHDAGVAMRDIVAQQRNLHRAGAAHGVLEVNVLWLLQGRG